MVRNVNIEVPTWPGWPCFVETSVRNPMWCKCRHGHGVGHVFAICDSKRQADAPPFGLHVGASWSLRLLEDEQMGGPGQGPTPALPLFLSVDCCRSFLIFQVTHS